MSGMLALQELCRGCLNYKVLSCVSAGKLHPELMTAAAWHSRNLMHPFQPQSVANMIWAYATLAHKPPEPFLDLLCHHTQEQLHNFATQNISNTIWALATLKYHNKVRLLLRQLQEKQVQVQACSAETHSRHISN